MQQTKRNPAAKPKQGNGEISVSPTRLTSILQTAIQRAVLEAIRTPQDEVQDDARKEAARGRDGAAPLLLQGDGTAWPASPSQACYRKVDNLVRELGLDPGVTLYSSSGCTSATGGPTPLNFRPSSPAPIALTS